MIDECRIGGELMGAAGASRRGAALDCDLGDGGGGIKPLFLQPIP
jgi:hypothetical protein